MAPSRTYQVKDVARFAGVSVRTLHHYDAIGLLVPGARTAAGYRLYTDSDLLRLQQVLVGRELGLALEEIRRSFDDPHFDLKSSLLIQKERLRERAKATEAMMRSIDVALAALDGHGNTRDLNVEELFEGFNPSQYEEEVRDRWGKTEAFIESAKRTKGYSPDEWKAIKAEHAALCDAAYAALKAGKSPSDAAVMDIAERHRLYIDRWFYACSYAMHRGLASMYESDERFGHSIDKHGDGLTPFLAESIRANASRHQE